MGATPDLRGHTIGVTADRRGGDQVVMFERMGAGVVLGPTIATTRIPNPDLLRARTEELAAEPPDFLIANTGMGMRTWMEAAEGWGLGDDLRRALGRTAVASRGPKASGALSSMGVTTWWRSRTEQLSEVVDRLRAEGLSGRRVALQLHGDDGAQVVALLEQAGATVVTVPVYVWTPPPDPQPALDLIDRTCRGEVHAVTFTAGPQIKGMLDLAEGVGRRPALLESLNRESVVVGCIGPVCARVATEAGIEAPLTPAHWRLGSLVKVVAEALG